MGTWYVDEGLSTLIAEWKQEFPKAVVYTIGDSSHSANPDMSQHAPDRGGSEPGDDRGEVDAGDFMPGNGVTEDDLDDLAEGLRRSKDPRVLLVIRRDRIFSSLIQPWTWRKYNGNYHGHTHISVNDKFDKNTADWKWEDETMAQPRPTMKDITTRLPELRAGMEDAELAGQNFIVRAQAMINILDHTLPPLDLDGVYGGKTAQKLARIMTKAPARSSTDGGKLYLPEWKTLYALS
jgi:hypothetical protein